MAHVHLVKRWLTFNAVGAMGVAVQLAVVAALARWGGLNYLAATAIAVEAAILHNFVWHQHWTWRDRRVTTARSIAVRLARFHVTNGIVSIAGNLAFATVLTGIFRFDPVVANAAAIAACSLVNFAASTTLVFRTAGVLVPVMLLGPAASAFAQPSDKALTAWKAYEASVDARYSIAGADRPARYFVQDALPASAGWRRAVLATGVTTAELDPPDVPGAQIHHWVGATFVPGVTLDEVLSRLQAEAGMEDRFYEDVVASRLLAREGDRLRVYMKLRRRTVLTVTYNTEHAVEYRRLGVRRASSRSVATRIAELADAATAAEREKPPGSDYGFLWRLNAYWRYEEVPGGVLIECESVTLSRRVPSLARPIVAPIVRRVARESLVRTLEAVRGVLSSKAPPAIGSVATYCRSGALEGCLNVTDKRTNLTSGTGPEVRFAL
ncbi:MAG TPA: GtrA family protein [Vicinamibacterales bacterium]|nr:GtrA family protein [Vicinamibacterales bacterium]